MPLAGALLEAPADYDERAWAQWGGSPYLKEVREQLAHATAWNTGEVEAILRGVVEEHGVKPKEIFQPIRVALTGTTVSPGIFESVAALGRDETLARLDKALQRAK
jgi:glutamyl-tRNA synthetase